MPTGPTEPKEMIQTLTRFMEERLAAFKALQTRVAMLEVKVYGPNEKNPQYNEPKPETPQPKPETCLLYTSPSPRDRQKSRMPSSA